MCQRATFAGQAKRSRRSACVAALAAVLALLGTPAAAQTRSGEGPRPDWRRIGNSAIEATLASPASGRVERAWFSSDGAKLFVRTAAGRVFETADREKWQPSDAVPPAAEPGARPEVLPALAPQWRRHPGAAAGWYAFGDQVYRTEDGATWTNLTALGRDSIIGGGMQDLAISPLNPEEVVVANERGVWRSVDGGASWAGLNEGLPNLPLRRFAALPERTRGVRLLTQDLGVVEWAPGEKVAWRPVADPAVAADLALRRTLSASLSAEITAVAGAAETIYAGARDGRIWVSLDRGRSWSPSPEAERGAVTAFYVDPREPRLALAALAADPRNPRIRRVLRTVNGGQYWDDLSSDLPEGSVNGITADRASGAIYVAADQGVYASTADLNAPAPAGRWRALAGLPRVRALDVRLDGEGNQLFVALEGQGVQAAMAPHRFASPRLVNAADFSGRPAAPGSLLSLLGGRVLTARSGDQAYPVLAASDAESQIQVPFSARGPSVALQLETGSGSLRLTVPVERVAPAVFIDRDGTPLVLNADTGVLLDGLNPARSNTRLQILATGLGPVRPDWPAGVAGPREAPPEVVAPVRVYLDRAPLEVTRAVLAPGYVGLYLVEVQLPAIVNYGPAELYLEAEGQASNRVRIDIEP